MIFVSILLFPLAARAAERNACPLKRLPGLSHQIFKDWDLTLEKEISRNREGDALLVLSSSSSNARCEIELESWGQGIYVSDSQPNLAIVEQGDTDYTTLTWIDLKQCRSLLSKRELGRVEIFSGGFRFPGKKIRLNQNCMPQ